MKISKISLDQETVCEKLLHLIEDGDAAEILSAEYTSSLNELFKNELITLENDRIQLTPKGREARLSGIKNQLQVSNPQQEKAALTDFPEALETPEMNRSLLIILIFFIVSIVAIFWLMSL